MQIYLIKYSTLKLRVSSNYIKLKVAQVLRAASSILVTPVGIYYIALGKWVVGLVWLFVGIVFDGRTEK